jgi:hypothetical protein
MHAVLLHAALNLFSILNEGHATAHLRGFIDHPALGPGPAAGGNI